MEDTKTSQYFCGYCKKPTEHIYEKKEIPIREIRDNLVEVKVEETIRCKECGGTLINEKPSKW